MTEHVNPYKYINPCLAEQIKMPGPLLIVNQ